MITATHDMNSASPKRTRSNWRRRFDRAVNNLVLLCATWTLVVSMGWILDWLIASAFARVPADNNLAGHALLGAILLVTGLAAFAFAVRRSTELKGPVAQPNPPRRADQQRAAGLASDDLKQEPA